MAAFIHRSTPLAALLLTGMLVLPGCGAHLRGLVQVEPPPPVGAPTVRLRVPDGHTWRLRLTEEAWPLRSLDGCTVQVEGRRWLRSFVVASWQVLDAGDGSAPFVGEVHRIGVNLMIEDRNSGMALILDEQGAENLSALEGHVVMVRGYIVGPQALRVVGYRVLAE
jgi:hypothetical protein